MKWKCHSPRVRFRAKQYWHLWFAWYPVRLGKRQMAWLEAVERKGTVTYSWQETLWSFEYRSPPQKWKK